MIVKIRALEFLPLLTWCMSPISYAKQNLQSVFRLFLLIFHSAFLRNNSQHFFLQKAPQTKNFSKVNSVLWDLQSLPQPIQYFTIFTCFNSNFKFIFSRLDGFIMKYFICHLILCTLLFVHPTLSILSYKAVQPFCPLFFTFVILPNYLKLIFLKIN